MKNNNSPNARESEVGEEEEGDDQVIGRAFGGSLLAFAVVAAIGIGIWYLVRPKPVELAQKAAPLVEAKTRVEVAAKPVVTPFVDITSASGLKFLHRNGAYGDKLLPETMGGGCAFLDFDNDGDQDVLLVNSADWPGKPTSQLANKTMALFRNDGKGNFSDATNGSGLDVSFYGMGVACGDYDNDGWVDLFFSTVGINRLFRNEKGKFVDVTAAAGVGGVASQWSTAAAWLDYDNDGLLDLFVGNYIKWTKEIDLAQEFQLVGVGRAYGRPSEFEGVFPYLYHNDGGGKFSDVSAKMGVQVRNPATNVPVAKTLGVVPVDLDGDGWIDLVVANDTVQNFVFHNQKGKGFKEIGVETGVAFDLAGNARGAMGIDAGRYRNDKSLGIIVGNFANEMNALYVSNQDPLNFTDNATPSGIGPETRLFLTFGFCFFDYDLDGRLDILAANGHLENDINKVQQTQTYEQAPQLFWNCGADQKLEFLPVTQAELGVDFFKPLVGRGAAFADIDGDGDLDVLISTIGGPTRLLRNDQKLNRNWLRIKLIGEVCNRDAIGAWIEVAAGSTTQSRQVMPTRSYLSQVELPVTFGLGNETQIDSVWIRWPDGSKQELTNVKPNQLHTIRQAGKNVASVDK